MNDPATAPATGLLAPPAARRLLVATLLAYALAALALVAWYGERVVFADEAQYLAVAEHLVRDGMYSRKGDAPDAQLPPGYPFALAPLVAAGASLPGVRAAQLGLLALAAVALARSRAAALSGPVAAALPETATRDLRATLVLVLVAASPVLPFTANLLYPQTVVAALFVALLLFALAPGRRHGAGSATLAGLGCGYAFLLTPTALSIAPVVAWAVARRARRPWLCAALVLATTLAPPAAWTLRNRVAVGEWIPLSSNFAANLGYAWTVTEPADGTEAAWAATDGASGAERASAEPPADPFAGGPVAVVLTLLSEPVDYLGRLGAFFASDNELQTDGEMSAARRWVLAASYYSLLVLVLLRLILARRAPLSDAERATLALYAITALFHALVFARVRYRLPFDFLLLLPAANALLLVAVGRSGSGRRRAGAGRHEIP